MEKDREYGEKIISLHREELSLSFPFLAPAIYGLKPVASPGLGFKYAISREGDFFFYDPERLIEDFMEGRDTAGYFLHSVLHCLLFHPFSASGFRDRELWDLSSDICVRDIMCRMGRETDRIQPKCRTRSCRQTVSHAPLLRPSPACSAVSLTWIR